MNCRSVVYNYYTDANLLWNNLFCRRIKQSHELEQEATKPDNTPKLDLGFKEGQTIRINFGVGDSFTPKQLCKCIIIVYWI